MFLWGSNCGRAQCGTAHFCIRVSTGAAQLSLRIQDGFTHVPGICCRLLAGAVPSPLHSFSLHVVFHSPGSLSACGLFSSQRQGLFTWWHSSKRTKGKFQDLKINSSNYLPPDFLLCEKNKLLNVWTTLVGHSLLWVSNSLRLQH